MNRYCLWLVVLAFALAGCANQPLVHNYSGDVNVRTLQVELAPIRDSEQSLSGNLSTVTKIFKGVQEVLDVFDPVEREKLIQQLHDFESILVDGIRAESGVPVLLPSDSQVSMQYGNDAELVDIEYQYPLLDGPYMNLFVTIYYTQRSELSVGSKTANTNYIELVPEIILQIDGYNQNDELFWRHTARHESDKAFAFGDNYILGVPTERLEESQIFLVPLAQGVVKNISTQP